MLIAIDANEANVQKRVGVNKFAFEVIWSIYKQKPPATDFILFLAYPPAKDLPPETGWWRYEVFGPKSLWTWTGLVKRLYFGQPKPDILFSPSHYGPLFSPIPFVVSIMDLGFLRWPQQFTRKDYFQLKYWTKYSAKRAKKIITISHFSKQDIIKTYGISSKKVIVAYPGYKMKSEKLIINNDNQKLKKKFKIKNDYLLHLGTLKPSKNIKKLLQAFYKLKTQNVKRKTRAQNLKLIICGKKGWLYEDIFQLVKKLGLEKEVIFTGYVNEKEKQSLIRETKALVLPSLWEGFGIPVLEAMAVGTPVVCSKIAALPEVAGKAAIYIKNPEDVDSISQALLKMLKLTEKQRKELIRKGLSQIKKFSWKRAGEKVLKSII